MFSIFVLWKDLIITVALRMVSIFGGCCFLVVLGVAFVPLMNWRLKKDYVSS